MGRYNKIYAGPVTEALPQVTEAPAAENATIMPGQAIKLSSGTFVTAGASDNSQLFIAQEKYLAMKGVDVAVAADGADSEQDTVIGLHMLPDQMFNVLVATGNNVAKGSALTTTSTGRFALATTSNRIVAIAEEAYNNTSGSDQLVRVRPAGNHNAAA